MLLVIFVILWSMYSVGVSHTVHFKMTPNEPTTFLGTYLIYPLFYTWNFYKDFAITMFYGIWACLDVKKAKELSKDLED